MNKYRYLFVIQSNYSGMGWEDIDETESCKDSRFLISEYRIAIPSCAHRVIQRRELNG